MGMRLTAVIVAALALAGCGGSDESAGPAETTAPATRTVTHALGKTTVPAEPKRIVVLNEYSLLDYLLAVGVTPVGSTGDPAADYPFGHWLQGKTDGVEMVGGTEEPNFEQIAALKPDLILANPWQQDIYAKLSAIAPTVGVPLSYSDYEEEFRYVAQLVGREDEAETVIARHHDRLEEFKERMGSRLADLEVSVVRIFDFGQGARIEGDSYVPTLLKKAGIRRPAAHEKNPDGIELGIEQIPQMDADVLLVYSTANAAAAKDDAKVRARFARNPLWRNLRAVRNDQVYVVDSFIWAGGGMLWAERVLDDLDRILATEG